MSWYLTVFEVIDMRSFSNLWYWIALAVLWSSASHWVLGVPFDMVTRARRGGPQAEQDLMDYARLNVTRILMIAQLSGLWILGLTCFVFSTLAILGFWYRVEFAQAVFLLLFPLTIVATLGYRLSMQLRAEDPEAPRLIQLLARHRIATQAIGMASIFVTSLWGMWQNLPH